MPDSSVPKEPMAFDPVTLRLLNEQVALESHASSSYLAMATWSEVQGYLGAAGLLYRQAEEERTHMLKVVRYLTERGVVPQPPAQGACPSSYASLHALLQAAYDQECQVTAAIHKLVSHALQQQDFATFQFLQWFVVEQREEEATAQRALELCKLIGTEGIGRYTLDQALEDLGKK